MPQAPSYPAASPDDTLLVTGVQDGRTKRLLLPPEVSWRGATAAEAREGVDDGTLMTPAKVAIQTNPLNNELQNFWGSWTENDAFTSLPGTALVPVGSTGYPISLIAAASDIRTVGITTGSAGIFYPGVVGTPAITGDTWRLGIVAPRTATSRFALVYFDTAGLTLWEISTGAWQRIADTESPLYDHRTTGFVASRYWHALPAGIADAPNISGTHITLMNRTENGNSVYSISVDYNASPVRYTVHWGRRDFRSPAAEITLSQVKTVLEGASGDARLDASAVKNLPQPGGGAGVPDDNSVSTVKLQSNSVTGAKVVDGTLTLGKLSGAGGTDGQVIKRIGGVPTWRNDNAAEGVSSRSVYEDALQNDSVTNRAAAPDLCDTAQYVDTSITAPKIANNALIERHYSPGSLPLSAVKTTGSTVGDLVVVGAGGVEYQAPPAWSAIGGSYTPSSATGTMTLTGTRLWSDYTEICIQGRGKVSSVTLPAILWNATSSTNRINLNENDSGRAQIWRSDTNELTYFVVSGANADHGIQSIYGKA